MSEPLDDSPHPAPRSEAPGSGETEEIDAVIVAGETRLAPYALATPPARSVPAPAQLAVAAAVAATGFAAGAVVVSLAHRRSARSLARSRPRRGRRDARVEGRGLTRIVASRSLLLDVHLLGGSDGDR